MVSAALMWIQPGSARLRDQAAFTVLPQLFPASLQLPSKSGELSLLLFLLCPPSSWLQAVADPRAPGRHQQVPQSCLASSKLPHRSWCLWSETLSPRTQPAR